VLSAVVDELLHFLWRSSLRTCVSTNSSIGLDSRPRDVARKKKKGCKLNIFSHSDVTCWIYCSHISSEMYGGLKSLQTITSFQPCRPLSQAYFFGFFLRFIPKVTQLLWKNLILYIQLTSI
jgi:hypothetical protein